MINQNKLAVAVTQREQGKKEVNIAQVKEVLKVTFRILSKQKPSEVLALIEKHGGRK